MATTRMQRTAVWDTIQFALNGVMFVLLGEQLPAILTGAHAERDTLFALARANEISDATSRELVRDIDLLEERIR